MENRREKKALKGFLEFESYSRWRAFRQKIDTLLSPQKRWLCGISTQRSTQALGHAGAHRGRARDLAKGQRCFETNDEYLEWFRVEFGYYAEWSRDCVLERTSDGKHRQKSVAFHSQEIPNRIHAGNAL